MERLWIVAFVIVAVIAITGFGLGLAANVDGTTGNKVAAFFAGASSITSGSQWVAAHITPCLNFPGCKQSLAKLGETLDPYVKDADAKIGEIKGIKTKVMRDLSEMSQTPPTYTMPAQGKMVVLLTETPWMLKNSKYADPSIRNFIPNDVLVMPQPYLEEIPRPDVHGWSHYIQNTVMYKELRRHEHGVHEILQPQLLDSRQFLQPPLSVPELPLFVVRVEYGWVVVSGPPGTQFMVTHKNNWN
jgi:hypothetical protein